MDYSEADQPPPEAADQTVKNAKPQWLLWALASGGFAAFNGVFAKLTTAGRTQVLAEWVARLAGNIDSEPILEVILRAVFFGMNILSNAIMWFLFTRALTLATSTTQVSILNTSANFLVTAMLGMLVFGEQLPLGWWLGAALLVAGSVIIGAREEKANDAAVTGSEAENEDAVPAEAHQGKIRLEDNGPARDASSSAAAQQEPYTDQAPNITLTEEPVDLRR